MSTPELELAEVLQHLRTGAQGALGEDFIGAYHVGSFALRAGDEASDVDFLIVTDDLLSDHQEAALRRLHARLPDLPSQWAQHLEGSYAPVAQLRRPAGEDRLATPWLYVDNGQRSMQWSTHDNSLVTRWIAREHGIVLAGPPAAELMDPISPEQLSIDARHTLAIWDDDLRQRPDQFADVLAQQQHVLGLCRLLHRIQHGRILSKVAAARSVMASGDDRWQPLLQGAVLGRSEGWRRSRQSSDQQVVTETIAFHRHVVATAAGSVYSKAPSVADPASTGTS